MAVYEYDAQNDKLNRIAGGTLFADLPIGFILPSFETVAPLGFLKMTDTLANRTVSRTTYKELFDWATERGLIGTGKPFGVGDGSTTFVIPDGKEIAFKGIGEYEGTSASHVKSGGLAVGEYIDDRLQDHNHKVNVNPSTSDGVAASNVKGFSGEKVGTDGIITGRFGATTEVKSLGCHYYIKAKNIGVPADFVSAIQSLLPRYPDYARGNIYVQPSSGDYIAPEDVFVSYSAITSNGADIAQSALTIDGVTVGSYDYLSNSYAITEFSGYVKKGSHINRVNGSALGSIGLKVFGLR